MLKLQTNLSILSLEDFLNENVLCREPSVVTLVVLSRMSKCYYRIVQLSMQCLDHQLLIEATISSQVCYYYHSINVNRDSNVALVLNTSCCSAPNKII